MRRKPDGAGSTSLKIGKRLFDIATGSNPRGGGDVAVQTAIQSIVSELAFPEETVKFFDELAGVDSEQ